MGDYIYKTKPATLRAVTIKLTSGIIIDAATIGEYQYAYKPYSSDALNRKMHTRLIKPAMRAFEKSGIEPPKYGVYVSDTHKHLALGDRVFDAGRKVAIRDQSVSTVGFIISLDPHGKDERTLAQRVDPDHFGYGFLRSYVADILVCNLPDGGTVMGDPKEYISAWKAKLSPEDRAAFEYMERMRHA